MPLLLLIHLLLFPMRIFGAALFFLLTSMRRVSGVLPVLAKDKLLFISNMKGHFIFPKGALKSGEPSFKAAQREALEEAGVEGQIEQSPFISVKSIFFHIMHVDKINPSFEEIGFRKRMFMTPSEALENELVPSYVKLIIKSAKKKGIIE